MDQFYYDYREEKTAEDRPIPRGSGTPEAYRNMWHRIWSMSGQDLRTIWNALGQYNPCDYYDRTGGVGMDDWAEAIASEMDNRGINKFE